MNDLATHVARSPEIFGGGNADRTREWTERFRNFFARPENEETRGDMGRALDEMERDGTEEQRDHVRRLRPLLKLEAEATSRLDATHRADQERLAEERRIAEERRLEAERTRIAAAAAGGGSDDIYGASPTGDAGSQRAEAIVPAAGQQQTARASQLSGNTPRA